MILKNSFQSAFSRIDKEISSIISEARTQGNTEQEIKILEAIKKGFKPKRSLKSSTQTIGEFFKLNDRKINALIEATQNDFNEAERAILRMAEDQYRQVIFNAQVYANTGAGTYEQAVDMATKDFISRGINCIQYANGARHTISDYADMAIRTASKRAYLVGEGEKRKEWGITTVIVNKRGNACPKCLPFVGKVLIDDVWSGGKQSDGPYMLMSYAMSHGLYHPRCKDVHTTYFEGISTPGASYTKEELKKIENDYRDEQKHQYAKRQVERFGRLAEYSIDNNNKNRYTSKRDEWKVIADNTQYDIINKRNDAKAIDSMMLDVSDEIAKYTRQQLLEEMQQSPIGISTINHIANSKVVIELINEKQYHTNRGYQQGNIIKIFLSNIKNKRVGAQTIIHEMTHYYYDIGGCQHAEAICFAMEKMHIENRNYLTEDEWNKMVMLSVDNYPELEWEDGGYGDFKQFDFVRRTVE